MTPEKAHAVIIELLNAGLGTIPPVAREVVAAQAKEALGVLFPAPVTEPGTVPEAPKE
jgi:hypothetical protein